MKRIGIFGGSFDPLHKGHLAVARAALIEGGLDEVWLMVSPQNPLKRERTMSPESDRLSMVRIALKESLDDYEQKLIKVSDFEFSLPRPSFTINTLQALSAKFPDSHFVVIIGEDNLRNLSQWRSSREIIENYGIIVYPRQEDNYREEEGDKCREPKLLKKEMTYSADKCVILKDVEYFPHSSTSIRERVRMGKEIASLTSEGIARYVAEHFLYRGDDNRRQEIETGDRKQYLGNRK